MSHPRPAQALGRSVPASRTEGNAHLRAHHRKGWAEAKAKHGVSRCHPGRTAAADFRDFAADWAYRKVRLRSGVHDESVFGGALGKGADDSAKPDLFAAISQQLGLKLETARGLVETLVIDHVQRPAEN